MENPFSNMQIHIGTIRNNREEIEFRLLAYKIMIQTRKFSQSPKETITASDKEKRLAAFWNKESYWENKIYSIMKRWEARHPIIGIVLCTISYLHSCILDYLLLEFLPYFLRIYHLCIYPYQHCHLFHLPFL